MRLLSQLSQLSLGLTLASIVSAFAAESSHPERPTGVSLDSLVHLTSQYGAPLTRADLAGRPFIVLFGYTHCPEVCPTVLFDLSMHLDKLGLDGNRLGVMFVTVDPERDTVPVLRDYLSSFDPRITGLTGSKENVAAVANAFGAKIEQRLTGDGTYSLNHSYMIFMVDKYGLLAKVVGYDAPKTLARYSLRLLAQ